MSPTESFLKIANTFPEFKESIEIVKSNSKGNIYLIGGFVCRSIIQEMYGTPVSKDVDLDFIVEEEQPISLPDGWSMDVNSYGNPKLIGPKYEIDYIPLKSIHSILRRGLEPTIENFLSGTPLNVQSIVYDVTNNKVIGDIGIKSIMDKIISVNNKEQAEHSANKKGVSVEEFVKDIAGQFNFQIK